MKKIDERKKGTVIRRVLTLSVAVLFVFNELMSDASIFTLRAGAFDGTEVGSRMIIDVDSMAVKAKINYIEKSSMSCDIYMDENGSIRFKTITDPFTAVKYTMSAGGEGCYMYLTDDEFMKSEYEDEHNYILIDNVLAYTYSPKAIPQGEYDVTIPMKIVFSPSVRGEEDWSTEITGLEGKGSKPIKFTNHIIVDRAQRHLIIYPNQTFEYGEEVNIIYEDRYKDEYEPYYGALSGVEEPIIQYKLADEDDDSFTTTAPTEPGKYEVMIFAAEDSYFKEDYGWGYFEILAPSSEITFDVADSVYGEPLNVKSTISNEVQKPEYHYLKDGVELSEAPKDAGKYQVYVVYPESGVYQKIISEKESFEIKKAKGSGKITIEDCKEGDELKPVCESETNGTDNVKIEYKKTSEEDDKYSETKPEKAGEYTVRATFAATNNYEEVKATATFKIESTKVEKLKGTGSIEIEDIIFGKATVTPILESKTNGIDNVEVFYKRYEDDDSSYNKEKPTEVGYYKAEAVFASTDKYQEVVTHTTFNILPAEKLTGKANIEVKDIYYGMKTEPVVTNDMKRKDYQIQYKPVNAPEAAYTDKQPSAIGIFNARAVFPEDKDYKECIAECTFAVSYMPAPHYQISGEMGNREFYISAVKVLPDTGYLISNSLDGKYEKNLTFTEGNIESSVYFMNPVTGGKTDEVTIHIPKIDITKPVISGANNGDSIYGDTIDLSIYDINLDGVSINGEDEFITDSLRNITLESNGGKAKYHIEATDLAGNKKEINFTLIAEWLLEKVVPEKKKIELEKSESYTLEAGTTWIKEGDDTVYQGGITFYVGNDENSSFSKGN